MEFIQQDIIDKEASPKPIALTEYNMHWEPANPNITVSYLCGMQAVVLIGELIETLSSPQKTAFILREVEGFSCREISKIMDCPGGTVRSHLHFARKRLKDLVEKHYPEFIEGLNHEM